MSEPHFCLACGEHHSPADCSLNPSNFPRPNLSERLRKLHVEMVECANDLRALEDSEAIQHGVELYGAAGIVIQWADKLEEPCSQPPSTT